MSHNFWRKCLEKLEVKCQFKSLTKFEFLNILWEKNLSIKHLSMIFKVLKVKKIYMVKAKQPAYWRHSGVFIVNIEQILHIVLMFLLLLWTSKCRLRMITVLFVIF